MALRNKSALKLNQTWKLYLLCRTGFLDKARKGYYVLQMSDLPNQFITVFLITVFLSKSDPPVC